MRNPNLGFVQFMITIMQTKCDSTMWFLQKLHQLVTNLDKMENSMTCINIISFCTLTILRLKLSSGLKREGAQGEEKFLTEKKCFLAYWNEDQTRITFINFKMILEKWHRAPVDIQLPPVKKQLCEQCPLWSTQCQLWKRNNCNQHIKTFKPTQQRNITHTSCIITLDSTMHNQDAPKM